MEFLGHAAGTETAWDVDGNIGAAIVAGVKGGVELVVHAEVGVPGVVTVEPGQIWGGTCHQEVQGPANDDVVVERHVERYQNRAETHA